VTVAATKAGIPLVLLNTMSSAEQLAEVVRREEITTVFADAASLDIAATVPSPVVGVGPIPGGGPTTEDWATAGRSWRMPMPRCTPPSAPDAGWPCTPPPTMSGACGTWSSAGISDGRSRGEL
jgi:hypothetical protein